MIQNSIDACRERKFREENFEGYITVEIYKDNDEAFLLVQDNGRGMTINEVKNYFLKAGASYRKSYDWKRVFTDETGKSLIQRNGRFGVGILASFLIGDKIEVWTKSSSEINGYHFAASIDSHQIEVKLKKNLETGTIIKIKSDFKTIQEIFQSKNSSYTRAWNDWYVSNDPKIVYIDNYSVNGGNSKNNNLVSMEDAVTWRSIYPAGFQKVDWSFVNIDDSFNLICNSIIIPRKYEIDNIIIKNAPLLSVTDFEGNLPLSLNRVNLLSKLSFEKDLMSDIYREFIAKLLNYKLQTQVDKNNVNILEDKVGHRAFNKGNKQFEALYHKDGFTLNYSYFLRRIETETIFSLYSVSTFADVTKLKFDISKFEQVFKFKNLSFSEIQEREYMQEVSTAKKLFLTKKVIANKGNYLVQKISKNVDVLSVEFKNIVGFYTGGEGKLYAEHFENIGDFLAVESVVNDNKNCEIFDKELGNFLGDNIFIPYNLEDRKMLFKDAMNDLKIYTK